MKSVDTYPVLIARRRQRKVDASSRNADGRRTMIRKSQITMGSTHMSAAELKQQVFSRRHKKDIASPKSTTIAAYVGIFLLIMSMVAIGYQPPQKVDSVANAVDTTKTNVADTDIDQPSVDQLVATNIAAGIAERADLPIAKNVANLSVSLSAESQLAQNNDSNVISKPQIIQPTADSREIKHYKGKAGDSAGSVGQQFGVSVDTVKWANNLTSDAIEPGKDLIIPPVDGLIYNVKTGDAVDGLAAKYGSDKDRIVAFNDLELGGLAPGKTIVLPGGVPPESERPGFSSSRSSSLRGSSSYGGAYSSINSQIAQASAGNRYAFGNCTSYAYERRMQLGRPVGSFWGNAATWAMYARAAGYTVNNTPKVGAVMQNGGGYGHVSIVESVNSDGSITISEMNYAGNFNRVTSRTMGAGTASGFNYIH